MPTKRTANAQRLAPVMIDRREIPAHECTPSLCVFATCARSCVSCVCACLCKISTCPLLMLPSRYFYGKVPSTLESTDKESVLRGMPSFDQASPIADAAGPGVVRARRSGESRAS